MQIIRGFSTVSSANPFPVHRAAVPKHFKYMDPAPTGDDSFRKLPAKSPLQFGSLVYLIAADAINGMGSLAGIDLAISTWGEHLAQKSEMYARQLPPDERAAFWLDCLQRGGPMKHWTAESVPTLIPFLPESTAEQRAIKLSLAKQAMRWYVHLNSPFNHFLALTVADHMADNQEFRQFMGDFYQQEIKHFAEDTETNGWIRTFFNPRRTMGGNNWFQILTGLATVNVAAKWTEKFENKYVFPVLNELKYAASYIFGKTPARTENSEPTLGETAPGLPEALKNRKTGTALTVEEVHLLQKHMENLAPPLNGIQPQFKTMYKQWVADHPVTDHSVAEDEAAKSPEQLRLEALEIQYARMQEEIQALKRGGRGNGHKKNRSPARHFPPAAAINGGAGNHTGRNGAAGLTPSAGVRLLAADDS